MKKILILFVFLCYLNASALPGNNQTGTWVWAKGFTSSPSGQANGNYIIIHPNGNIYCLGSLAGYGYVTNGTASVGGTGNFNSFVTVFDENGNLLNIRPVSGLTTNDALGIDGRPTVDDSGYLYIALGLTGSGLVDTIHIGNVQNNGYLSKWNPEGRCLWAKFETSGSGGSSLLNPIYYGGSIYTSGSYGGSSMSLGNCNLLNPGNAIIPSFNGKMDMVGNCDWLKQATGAKTGSTLLMFLSAVQNGHAYLCCRTDSCFFYDTIQRCSENTSIKGYVMQVDTSGAVQWIRSITSAHDASGTNVSVDAGGNSYMTGAADSTLYIGNDTIYKPQQDIAIAFLAKYDKLGHLLWVQTIPFTSLTVLAGLYTDAAGYTYITGYNTGTATFGNITITAQSPYDLYIARYDPNGNCMGVVTVPNAQGLDISEDTAGNAYVTGQVLGNGVFGSFSLAGNDFFVAKLSAIVDTATNIPNLLPDNLLQIYANPSRGLFTVVVPQSIVQANNGNLLVYDSQGGIVINRQVDITSSHVQVDLGEVTRGVYTVILSANGLQFTGRVTIQ